MDDQSLHGKVVSALAAGARSRSRSAGDIGREHIPVMVLAGQVTLDGSALRERLRVMTSAAYSISDHAGSVQRAIDDAANQLAGLAQVTAAGLGNSGITRYR